MSELPSNWQLTKLDKVLSYKKGKKPKRLEDQPFEGCVPYLDIKAFEKDEVVRYADPESSNLIEKESVGIVWDGARSGWVSKGKKGAVGSTIAILKPIKVETDFLYRFLQSKFNYINTNTRGTGIPHVDPQVLWDIDFPLPPLGEQKRMVAKLDVLFGELEALKDRLSNIPELLKNFRQAVLTQAVTGKLTAEWRLTAAAEGKDLGEWETSLKEVVKKREEEFLSLKKQNKVEGIKAPSKPEFLNHKLDDVNPYEIESWFEAPVGFLSDCIVPGRDKPKSFTGNTPWITTPDLTSDLISTDNAKLYLSAEEIKQVKAKVIPVNSVVISIVGRFGISCVIKDACVINQQLHAFLPSDLVIPKYLMYYFRTQEGVMNSIATSTTVAYINKTNANSIRVNVPPKEEQEEIVRRVEGVFAQASAIEESYEQLKTKIDNLPQAVLAKAFRGELVEQLPTDGDAKVLLEEIKALKQQLALQKKKKKTVRKKRANN